jgi:hypothetical protein
MKKVRIERKTADNQPDLFPKNDKYFSMVSDNPEVELRSSVKEVNKEFANVEAERGESVFTKDGNFFTIEGKKHSQGGTHLSLEEGDFIFSDKLKVKGKEVKDLYNWVNPSKRYSYSDLAKYYGKHMKKFMELGNSQDHIDRTTADLMKENIASKLSEVAVLQEAEKGFPQGMPSFAEKTFARKGGFVRKARLGDELIFFTPANSFKSSFELEPTSVRGNNNLPPINDPNKPQVTARKTNLRFSIPDTLALANSFYNLTAIPKITPTRVENFGIPQAMGILTNQRPLDYQSQINEVNKSLSQAASAINTYSRSPQHQAALISNLYGQALESASRIRGAEYNANSQLENQANVRLAEYMVARGEDLANSALRYNQSLDNLRQNFYEDTVRARNNMLQTVLAAYNNALAVNTENQLNPNYRINPSTLQIEFVAPNYNPITGGAGVSRFFNPLSTIKQFADEINETASDDDYFKRYQEARRIIRGLPRKWQEAVYKGEYPG